MYKTILFVCTFSFSKGTYTFFRHTEFHAPDVWFNAHLIYCTCHMWQLRTLQIEDMLADVNQQRVRAPRSDILHIPFGVVRSNGDIVPFPRSEHVHFSNNMPAAARRRRRPTGCVTSSSTPSNTHSRIHQNTQKQPACRPTRLPIDWSA